MGQQQSKDVLLYQHVNSGNIEGVKALRRDGARLEWIDKEGKTPLIVACMKPELHNVARTLIEFGANVNAYGSGRHAGTPLHHAAKRGLEQTVKLLLAHGANALVLNDDYQTPLDVARVNGNCKVVRAIEGHIGLFSGWMREFYGPGFLELFAPRWLSRKVWAVIVPCGSLNRSKPFKLELAIYTCPQDAQPRTIIALWKAKLEEPKFNQADLSVSRDAGGEGEVYCPPKRRGVMDLGVKLGPANEGDKQQLQWFCNACKGIPQARHRSFPVHTQYPVVAGTAPSTSEDVELAMAINASLQSATTPPGPRPHASTSWTNPSEIGNPNASAAPPVVPVPPKGSSSGCEVKEFGSSGNPPWHIQAQNSIPYVVQTPLESLTSPASGPSAPPIADTMTDDGPIHYPSIDFTPVDISSLPATTDGRKEDADGTSSSCVICLDAPVEGACIPCGHMAGCMSCLNEIKAKKWGCPVCRTNIDQVIRLYAV